ncbi:MAG: MBL fold metallo-hydrolase [Cyanobacteria bacterium P01_H01_bin.15]
MSAKPSSTLLSCLPLGVGQGGDGVCLSLQVGPYRLLLDSGFISSSPDLPDLAPDWIFVSHAQSDHAQALLSWRRQFLNVPVYASSVTTQLLPLNWPGESGTDFCQPWAWRSPYHLAPDLTAEIFPAGHLPGAASLCLRYYTRKRTYKILYTGAFCLSNFQLVDGLNLEPLRGLRPDVLILEGTYGTARHPHRRQQEKNLMARIDRALSEGENVLLPMQPLGSGQEVLKLLRSHHQFTGRDLDIWVGGRVMTACDHYLELLDELPSAVRNFAKHQPLFWDDKVKPRGRRLESPQDLHQTTGPMVLITDEPADFELARLPANQYWRLLLPETPQQDPLRQAFVRLTQSPQVTLDTYLLAEHSDGRNTIQLIHNLRPQHLVLVNGSSDYLNDLACLPELANRYQIHCPQARHLVELPLGNRFVQPAAPEPAPFEGEVNETRDRIVIGLPKELTQAARWEQFAASGLVEARWQGDSLVLRGVSPRELLSQTRGAAGWDSQPHCRGCRFWRNQYCWQAESPFCGLKVAPDSYCPSFAPQEDVEMDLA